MTINRRAMQDGNVYGIVNLTRIRADLARTEQMIKGGTKDEFIHGVRSAYSWILSDDALVEEL